MEVLVGGEEGWKSLFEEEQRRDHDCHFVASLSATLGLSSSMDKN